MSAGELYVYNYVSLDRYTRGVAEIKPEWAKPSWPSYYAIEAVKAQAVAARTYAYADYLAVGYLNDDTRDIVYKGYAYEVSNPGAAQAAIDTNGEVVKYSGNLYKTFFSSHSGGYTTTSAWSDYPPPYLVSQPDPWSRVAPPEGLTSIRPGYAWTVTMSPATMRTQLLNSGYIDDVGTITQVDVISRDTPDPESHATLVRVTGTSGSDTITARRFRSALGLRSTLILSTIVEGQRAHYEQDHDLLTYSGRWSTYLDSNASGGSFDWTSQVGAALVAKFEGTNLGFLATPTPPGARSTGPAR
jgi:stage II sporulation protein D